jgi:hypothetical protein
MNGSMAKKIQHSARKYSTDMDSCAQKSRSAVVAGEESSLVEDLEAKVEEDTIPSAEGMVVVDEKVATQEEEGMAQAGMVVAGDTEEGATVAVAVAVVDVDMSLAGSRMADTLARGKVAVSVFPKNAFAHGSLDWLMW